MKKIYSPLSLLALFFLPFTLTVNATNFPFHNTYTGTQEVPPNASPGRGSIVGSYDDVTNTISYTIIFSDLTAPTVAAHFHAPAPPGVNAPVIIPHTGFPTGVMSGSYSNSHVITDAQEVQLLAGMWYSNIHTTALPGGEIRTQILLGNPATTFTFSNRYSGSQEVPPNGSPGTGTIVGSYDHTTNTISYSIIFSGLVAPTVAAHFHAPAPPGVNAPVIIPHTGFPNGVMSGFYSNSHIITDAQETQLFSGLWYSNIHTTQFPGGEIRTQIMLSPPCSPMISDVSASPNSLWPPNHKMRDVMVKYRTTSNCPGPISCQLSVTSNEPVNDIGDGNTAPDWMVVDNRNVKLRAERSGPGNGRIYTITITCTQFGRTTTSSTTVTVPHDMGEHVTTGSPRTGEMESVAPGLNYKITNNPGYNYFTLSIQTNSVEKISVRVTDLSGRLVELRSGLVGSQVLRIGENLKGGVYFMQLRQGKQTKQVKLVKMK